MQVKEEGGKGVGDVEAMKCTSPTFFSLSCRESRVQTFIEKKKCRACVIGAWDLFYLASWWMGVEAG